MESRLIKKAKEKFKIGTIFSNANLGFECENVKVDHNYFVEEKHFISINTKEKGWFTIYNKLTNTWATIHNQKNYELWEK